MKYKYGTLCCMICVLSFASCSSTAPLPKNIAPEQLSAAKHLAALDARMSCRADGRITEVDFYYDSDANNPVVHDRDIECLAELSDLEVIGLEKTEISDAGLITLTSLDKLHTLALPRTITDQGLAVVGNMKALRSLHLWACSISDEGLSHLTALTNIERLDLTGTRVTERGLVYLTPMTKLQCLVLDQTAVAGEGLRALNELPALRVLDLAGTSLSYADVEVIRPTLARLAVLALDRSPITDRELLLIQESSNLKSISLTETKVTQEGIERFRKQFPNCAVNKSWSTQLGQ